MNLSAQEYLAKLLAKENLSVQHGNYSTASFDVVNRVLRLPLWKDKGKDVYDLLVGHEVGHALYTPADGWHDSEKKIGNIPRAYLNIVEDIRIERMIQDTYPGIVRRFKAGYKRLFDDDLFGTNERDINKAGLMDRLNVSSKGRGYVPVEFSDDESPLINEAMAVKTWDDVLIVCKKLFDFIEANKPEDESEEMDIGTPGDESSEATQEGEESMSSAPGDEPTEDEGDGEESDGNMETRGKGKKEREKMEKEEAPAGHETWTEDTQREREEDLLEKSPEKNYEPSGQPQFSSGISEKNMEQMLYTYDVAKKLREERVLDDAYNSTYIHEECKADWNETKGTYKSQANLIAKDFERKKAAFEYSKATTAKSGKLDPLKLHSYMISEDIFLSTTKLAQAKSHGIIMFLDMSGSMCDILEDVTAQAITIAMFCRQVNIPFEAYSFTTTAYWRQEGTGIRRIKPGPSNLDAENVKVVEMFSNKMNKKLFDEAAFTSFAIAKSHSYNRRVPYHMSAHSLHAVDGMGSTPLIQTAMLAAKITNEFNRKHAIQNTNIMFLTDGYPDGVHIERDEKADVTTSREMMINFNGKLIKGQSGRKLYYEILLRLKEVTGATIMGFHLAYDSSTFGQGFINVNGDGRNFPDVIKEWRKDGFTAYKNEGGYDDYFIIKINRSARFDSDEFIPKKAETINDLKREFKKFNKTKKGNKQLVARITDAVAA